MRSSKGFTLVEIVVVLAVIALLSAMAMPFVFERLETAKIEASVGQAQKVLQFVDMARVKVSGSVTSASPLKVTHTQTVIPVWQPVSAVQAILSGPYNIPTTNPFGAPILVRFDSARSYVAVDLPFSIPSFGWHTVIPNGPNSRIIVSTRPDLKGSVEWVKQQKLFLHEESSR